MYMPYVIYPDDYPMHFERGYNLQFHIKYITICQNIRIHWKRMQH